MDDQSRRLIVTLLYRTARAGVPRSRWSRATSLGFCLGVVAALACRARDVSPDADTLKLSATAGAHKRISLGNADSVAPRHIAGSNLPPWAACWFPHRANEFARRRAEPCPAEAEATVAYAVGDIAGCWDIADSAGRPLETPNFRGPFRFREDPNARMRQRGWTGQGLRAVDALTPVPPAGRPFDRVFVTVWRFAPPDSVFFERGDGYGALVIDWRVRGDSMVGMLTNHWDVISYSTDTTTDPVERMVARRIRCPGTA